MILFINPILRVKRLNILSKPYIPEKFQGMENLQKNANSFLKKNTILRNVY